MHEYVTRAVTLDKETRNDADARYSFFTERFGKIAANATSSRKITSKLAGHLEPGTLAMVRIVEQHGVRVVDALAVARVPVALHDLAALNQLLGDWDPDVALWNELIHPVHGNFSWRYVLAALGWDPEHAMCTGCGGRDNVGGGRDGGVRTANSSRAARHFFIPQQEFFCAICASKFRPSEVLLI